ncbi:MAG TPA: LamG domain-containing protein, partial [Thermoanaerobaculia bacterium]|nr:LamG domain-containing protein [Thermoanaerobaculia bacterium]
MTRRARAVVVSLSACLLVAAFVAPLGRAQGGGIFRAARLVEQTLLGLPAKILPAPRKMPGIVANPVRALAASMNGVVPVCVAPPSGLLHWWPGDGNANDLVGGYHGTLSGSATFAAGEVGQAFSFDGNTGGVVISRPGGSDNLNFGTGDFTIDAWVKIPAAAPGGHRVVFDDGYTGNSIARLSVQDQHVEAFFRDNVGNQVVADGATALNDNTWHHLAVVRTGTTGLVYVDGLQDGSSTNAALGSIATNCAVALLGGSQTSSFCATSPGENLFTGQVDEVEVFNRALSASEIQAIHNAGSAGKCRSCTGVPSGIAGWWRAENDANDFYNLNNGTLQGGATFAPGEVGQAFSFDGVNDFVSFTGTPTTATDNWTIDAWINPANLSQLGMAVSNGFDDGTNGDGYALGIGNGSGAAGNKLQGLLCGVVFLDSGFTFPAANQWYHVAMVRDSGTTKFYVNGTQTPNTFTTAPKSPTQLRIGGQIGIRFFAGLVDEVEVFSRALSQPEIAAIANAGSAGKCSACTAPPLNLASWWRAENNANDFFNNNNGTVSGGVTFTPGKVNQAFTFNGTDGEVVLPNSASAPLLNFEANDSFTIDAWLRPDPSVLGTNRVAVSLTYACTPENILLLVLTDGRVDFSVRDNLGNSVDAISPSSILDGNWHHATGVRDVGTRTAKLYLDGVEVTSLPDITTGTFTRADGQNRIGSIPVACPTERYFWKGQIDEVEVFRRALSQPEIAAIANAGSSGKCAACAPVPPNIVSWWRAENNADDAEGANNGSLQGGAAFAAGEVGQAFSLNGTSAFVDVPDSPSLNPTSITLDAWVFPTADNGGEEIIVNKEATGITQWEISRLAIASCTSGGGIPVGNFAFYLDVGGLPNDCGGWVDGRGFLPLNTWSHVALTYEAASGIANAYVNGALTRQVALNGSLPASSGTLKIGGRLGGASWPGRIDEVELFSRALTQ